MTICSCATCERERALAVFELERAAAFHVDTRGVVEVLNHNVYTATHTIACRVTTCGQCGRMWDDAVATSWTPAPSGRCPFESEHEVAG